MTEMLVQKCAKLSHNFLLICVLCLNFDRFLHLFGHNFLHICIFYPFCPHFYPLYAFFISKSTVFCTLFIDGMRAMRDLGFYLTFLCNFLSTLWNHLAQLYPKSSSCKIIISSINSFHHHQILENHLLEKHKSSTSSPIESSSSFLMSNHVST